MAKARKHHHHEVEGQSSTHFEGSAQDRIKCRESKHHHHHGEDGIVLPWPVLEALMNNVAAGNNAAVIDVMNQVRGIAEEQVPERFGL